MGFRGTNPWRHPTLSPHIPLPTPDAKSSPGRTARSPDGPASALHPMRGGSLPLPAPPPAGSRVGAKDDSSGAPHTRALRRRRLRSIFVCLDQNTSSFSQNPTKLTLSLKCPGAPLGNCWGSARREGEPGRGAPLLPHPSHPTAKQLGLVQAESFIHDQNLGWGEMSEGERTPQDLESEAAPSLRPSGTKVHGRSES